MHPPLNKPHPLCQIEIEALRSCHENNPVLKFFGVCNHTKAAMDVCFRLEKKAKIETRDAERRKYLVSLAEERDE